MTALAFWLVFHTPTKHTLLPLHTGMTTLLSWLLLPCTRPHSPQVVDGFEVVKAMESMGSRSGATSYEVVIADCGSLPKGETLLPVIALQSSCWQGHSGSNTIPVAILNAVTMVMCF